MISASPAARSIRRDLLIGLLVSLLFVAVLGGWSATAEIAGAVVAPGHLVVDSNVKKIQHPTGGIVGELSVRDGSYVKAGDVVVRLDQTQTRANLAVFTKGLEELYARRARLDAEKTAAESISFPEELLSLEKTDAAVASLLAGERKLFSLRAEARSGQKAQLRERVVQLQEEVSGLAEQIRAKTEELVLIQEELTGLLDLWEKHLVAITRVSALKRDAARLEGERGQLIAAKAAANGKISETGLQIIQIDADAWSKAAEELSEVRAKISEFSERKVAAEDQLKRVDILAPQTGRVHQLSIHTIGGVIGPGETIMLIVPDNDNLSIEAKVAPGDVDQLQPHQKAILRFSAFSQRTTPELNGNISWISADLTEDPRTGNSYYTVRIAVSDEEVARLQGLKILPGMPVEAFIQTGNRTVLSYLLKPLSDQVMRAFRES